MDIVPSRYGSSIFWSVFLIEKDRERFGNLDRTSPNHTIFMKGRNPERIPRSNGRTVAAVDREETC